MEKLPTRAAWWGVAVLFLAWTVSFMDRIILSLLIEPIQADLGIGDTAISLLHGAAFALFYTVLGIPIARIADVWYRKPLILSGMIMWNIASGACGLARNFTELLIARMLVGVGEASLSPAAYSMIYDWFPRRLLGLAHAIYNSGVTVGAGLAFMIGGAIVAATSGIDSVILPIVGEVRSWQIVFFCTAAIGVPSVLLAATLVEPQRTESAPVDRTRLSDLLAFVRGDRRAALGHLFGFASAALAFNAILAWAPTFLVRSHGLSRGDAGLYLGLGLLIAGSLGMVAGGRIADALLRRGHLDGHLRACAGAGVMMVPCVLPTFLLDNSTVAIVGLFLVFFFGAFPFGIGAAALQLITPPPIRAQMSAVYLFFVNLFGIGMGPTLTALLTDYVFGNPDDLGYSLAVVTGAFALLSASIFLLTLRPFSRSAESLTAR